MSQADQEKWDARYRAGSYSGRTQPSALLAKWLPDIPRPLDPPSAIDVACGRGRNAIYLAEQGWQVDAVDISTVALESLAAKARDRKLPITCRQLDLDLCSAQGHTLARQRYDLVIVFRYADLPLIEAIPGILNPGGYLVAEKHMVTGKAVAGPSSPEFRVQPEALKLACRELDILWYREGIVTDPDGRPAALAQVVARRPGD